MLSLGLRDGEIAPEKEGVFSAVVDLICSERPDLVITHAPNDYMPDHNALSRIVFDATFLATLPGSSKNFPHAGKVPSLYYMDNLAGIGFQPTLYVDITDTFETKLEMLGKHHSQLVWLKEHDNVDIIDCVKTMNKYRGMQAGCAYAEGFVQHMAWPRPNAVSFPV